MFPTQMIETVRTSDARAEPVQPCVTRGTHPLLGMGVVANVWVEDKQSSF